MTSWTILLKSSDGVQSVIINADIAEYSDDGQFLEFTNIQSLDEAISLFGRLTQEKRVEEQKTMIMEILRAAGKIGVASFPSTIVIGYYQTQNEGSELE